MRRSSVIPRISSLSLYFVCLSLFLSFTCVHADLPELPEANTVQTRQHNIHLMRNVLKDEDYQGYDIIIISSTSKEEADYQQNQLERTFAGAKNKMGRKPIILSVVDSTEGGQLIGSVYTWMKAEEMMRDKHPSLMAGSTSLIAYIQSNRLKAAAFHNGGKGERCSPLTQSLGNSRGSQKLVGSVKNALGREIELDILSCVVLQCSSFAATNQGTHLDTYWTSQVAFGSYPHDKLNRSNYAVDKFLVGFDKTQLSAQNIADFGTAALNSQGRMIAFYGNKRFASRKGSAYVIDEAKINHELLSKGDRVAYDFGSFAVSLEMWEILVDYWKRKCDLEASTAKSKIKRDIDPHFVQPCIRFLYGIHDLADKTVIDKALPSPASLKTKDDLKSARLELDKTLSASMLEAHAYIWEDVVHETDPKKKAEAAACMEEVMEFYLLYHHTPPFSNLKKVFGFIDLGNETQWFRYRRPIDIMNEKFEMLSDVTGRKTEVQLDGSIHELNGSETDFQRSREARLMRGIADDRIASFKIEGKPVTMTLAEIKSGKTVDHVYVKNSIIQNSDLTKGSVVIDSIVNNVTGQVIARHSYLESSTSPLIEASTSIVHQAIDAKPVKSSKEVVSDVFKAKLSPPYHGRMRAPIGYDPKGMPIYKIAKKGNDGTLITSEELDDAIGYFVEKIPYEWKGMKEYSDKTARTEDGRFTFEEIREIEPLKAADHQFRDSLDAHAKKAVHESRIPPKLGRE